MGYVLKAVLSSAQHPEYGQITPAHILWRPQCQPVTVRVGTMSRWSQNRTRYSVSPEMPLTGSL